MVLMSFRLESIHDVEPNGARVYGIRYQPKWNLKHKERTNCELIVNMILLLSVTALRSCLSGSVQMDRLGEAVIAAWRSRGSDTSLDE